VPPPERSEGSLFDQAIEKTSWTLVGEESSSSARNGTLECHVSKSTTLPLFAFLFFIACAALSSCSSPHPDALAITHVTVIEGTGAAPKTDYTVIVEASHIAAVGSSAATSIPRNARVINGSGKFLIPGLADMHIHLTGAGEPTGSREFIIPLLVANGITTVRDMGGSVEALKQLREEINSGKRLGPQIFFTGPYLDGNPPSFQPSMVVQNAVEATTAVDELKKQGVDFIKVQSRLQPEPYYAIAQESKKQEIRFVGHVPDSITATAASQAGQSSIEHLTGVLLDCSTREDELRQRQLTPLPKHETKAQANARDRQWTKDLLDSYSQQRADKLIQTFLANPTWQVPTFPVLVHIGFLTPDTDLKNDPKMKYIPKETQDVWQKGRDQQLDHRGDEEFALRAEAIQRLLQIVGKMNAAGVPIMAGTDSTAPNVIPGFSLHEDLAYLVQAGLSPMQALQAATVKPAEFLHRTREQGTIAAGRRADLVLLDANPLEDIHNTEKIRAVILDGKFLDRPDLDALLTNVEQFASSQ
jgi:imidazolonepropionase-like amidohydrolase